NRTVTVQQVIPSKYIHKAKLEDYLSTTNDPGSVKVTRVLDKYQIQYTSSKVRQLSWVRLVES
ncbi:uncharacterized protein A1O5_01014, partial [Cladophialophora psammophila CBS 110553]